MPVSRYARFACLSRSSFFATRSIWPSRRISNRTFGSGVRPTRCHRKQRHSVIHQAPCPHDRRSYRKLRKVPSPSARFSAKMDRGSTEGTFAPYHGHSIAVWRRSERDHHGSQTGLGWVRVGQKSTIPPCGTTQATIKSSARQVEASRDIIRVEGCRGEYFCFGEPPRGNKSFARSVFTRGQLISVLPRR
jgi:hypothetical protein